MKQYGPAPFPISFFIVSSSHVLQSRCCKPSNTCVSPFPSSWHLRRMIMTLILFLAWFNDFTVYSMTVVRQTQLTQVALGPPTPLGFSRVAELLLLTCNIWSSNCDCSDCVWSFYGFQEYGIIHHFASPLPWNSNVKATLTKNIHLKWFSSTFDLNQAFGYAKQPDQRISTFKNFRPTCFWLLVLEMLTGNCLAVGPFFWTTLPSKVACSRSSEQVCFFAAQVKKSRTALLAWALPSRSGHLASSRPPKSVKSIKPGLSLQNRHLHKQYSTHHSSSWKNTTSKEQWGKQDLQGPANKTLLGRPTTWETSALYGWERDFSITLALILTDPLTSLFLTQQRTSLGSDCVLLCHAYPQRVKGDPQQWLSLHIFFIMQPELFW